MKRLACLFATAFILSHAVAVYAEDTFGESLDWLVMARSGIAVETVSEVAPVIARTGGNQLSIHTTLKAAIKGNPPPQASFVRRWQPMAVPGQDDTARPPVGTDYLLFFDDHGIVTNAINLSFPSRRVGFGADANDVALANDFSIFKSADLIMGAVHERMTWLKAHPLPQGAASSDAVPDGAVQMPVPMTSPAWDVLYAGSGQCSLRIPADEKDQAAASTSPAEYKVEFSGPALGRECFIMPSAEFHIKSAVAKEFHLLTPTCGLDKNNTNIMALTFDIHDVPHDADYDFQWGSNPDDPDSQRGFFTNRKSECEDIARIMKFRLPHQTEIPATMPNALPMYASWTVNCMADYVWQFVMDFQLSIRSTPEAAAMATSGVPSPVSSAVATKVGGSDIIILPPKPAVPAAAQPVQ